MIEWEESKHGNSSPTYWAYLDNDNMFCLSYEGSGIYHLAAWFMAGSIREKIEYSIEQRCLEAAQKEAKKIILKWADDKIKELKEFKGLAK
jgi:hypothetical protein